MAKEFLWDVTIDGISHQVSCISTGNKYEIWVDDADLTVVYRQSFRRMGRGLEQEVQIGGRKCIFLVWDERPELVVDGVILRTGKDFLKEKAKRKKHMITVLWCIFAFGFAVLGYAIAAFCLDFRGDRWDWIDYGVYVLAGLWIIVDATMEMKHWKEQ